MAHECSCQHDAPAVAADRSLAAVRAEQTVTEVARERAGALDVMKELGINHCCGAHLTLREAAAAAGVPLDTLLAALEGARKSAA
jgi:iron-sulfur cluster repair protein YtfE (RIC family)